MPAKKRFSRSSARRRKTSRWKRLVLALLLAAVALPLAVAALARWMAPLANSGRSHFDAIVVFGSPANKLGKPTERQLAKLQEAVREYERGVAPRLILTGGAVRNSWVESQVMAQSARAEGLPESVLFLDTHSKDTIQNGCQVMQIMQTHGWRSAELVSDAEHLPRIAMIFDGLPLEWRTHAAPPLRSHSLFSSMAYSSLETLKTARYLFWTRWHERCF